MYYSSKYLVRQLNLFLLFGIFTVSKQPAPSPSASPIMPENVEEELYQHVVWLCENCHTASWDNIRAVAWQLGIVAGMQGEDRERRAFVLVEMPSAIWLLLICSHLSRRRFLSIQLRKTLPT